MANEITSKSAKKSSTEKSKKTTEKNVKEEVKKASKSSKKSVTEKKTAKKAVNSSKKVENDKKTASKAKSTTSNKKATTTRKTASTRKPKSTAIPMLTEYYDLPYRYNQTIVKVLAQTPTTLFVYWDISDEDRKTLQSLHGENFFNETKPILIVHNVTKNYSFEIEINDFANSWYIRNQDPDCDYVIELGRKDFEKPEKYVHIYSSNDIISPNNHILFENTNLGNVLFKNVKTGAISSKDFGSLSSLNNIDKLYGNVYDIYSRLYDEEIFDEIKLPSSNEFTNKK